MPQPRSLPPIGPRLDVIAEDAYRRGLSIQIGYQNVVESQVQWIARRITDAFQPVGHCIGSRELSREKILGFPRAEERHASRKRIIPGHGGTLPAQILVQIFPFYRQLHCLPFLKGLWEAVGRPDTPIQLGRLPDGLGEYIALSVFEPGDELVTAAVGGRDIVIVLQGEVREPHPERLLSGVGHGSAEHLVVLVALAIPVVSDLLEGDLEHQTCPAQGVEFDLDRIGLVTERMDHRRCVADLHHQITGYRIVDMQHLHAVRIQREAQGSVAIGSQDPSGQKGADRFSLQQVAPDGEGHGVAAAGNMPVIHVALDLPQSGAVGAGTILRQAEISIGSQHFDRRFDPEIVVDNSTQYPPAPLPGIEVGFVVPVYISSAFQ